MSRYPLQTPPLHPDHNPKQLLSSLLPPVTALLSQCPDALHCIGIIEDTLCFLFLLEFMHLLGLLVTDIPNKWLKYNINLTCKMSIRPPATDREITCKPYMLKQKVQLFVLLWQQLMQGPFLLMEEGCKRRE